MPPEESAAPATQTPTQDPQSFSVNDAVDNVFAQLATRPRPEQKSIPPPVNTVTSAGNEVANPEQVVVPPSEPPAPPSKETNWEKRYNDLQSDMDRRVNKAVEKVAEQFNGQIQALTAALMQARQPTQQAGQQPEEGYDPNQVQSVAQLRQLIRQEAENLYAQRVAADPRIAAGGMLGDWARFRGEFPDSPKYDFLTQIFLEEFPTNQSQDLYGTLAKLYKVGQRLEQKAQELANGSGEAARNQTPPTAPQGNPQQANNTAAALADRAARYRMETGISSPTATRPVIDTDGPLESALDAIVNSAMRGRR